MSVYAPSGSGNVHVDRVMGSRQMPPKAKAKKGMGFKAAAKATGLPPKQANAVIASAARKASPAAKAANPNLKKVAAKKATPKTTSGGRGRSGGSYGGKGGKGK